MVSPLLSSVTEPSLAGPTHTLLDRAVSARPDAPAVCDADGLWSYAELGAAAAGWTRHLVRRGIRPGDRVLARLGTTRDFVALLFGASRAGAVLVPVGTAMKRYQLAQVLRDAEPALAVGRGADAAGLRELTDVPVEEARAPGPFLSGAPAPGRPAPPLPRVPVSDDDLALLIYTSGSTAAPKGVMSPHRAVRFATSAIAQRLRYRPDDVILNVLPFSFDYGLYQIFLSVAAGSCLVLGGTESHVGLMKLVHAHRATVLPLVPSLAQMLVRLAARDGRPAPHVRLFTNTGAALTPGLGHELRAAFPSAAVAPMYGTTECKRITVLEPGEDVRHPGSVGRPLDGTQVTVVGPDGTPLPAGGTGEITVRGPHVMAGYWRAPEQTRERFRPHPVTGETTLYTGDFGHLDEAGHLYVHGRRDDMFKRRGVRMSALEIEAAAADVPGVTGAALVPPSAHGGPVDMVLFVASGLAAQDVLAGLSDRLEPAKVPHVCHVLPDLPLTPNGKTDKKRLRELALLPPSA